MKEGQTKAESKATGSARDVMLFVVVLSLCAHSTSRDGWKRKKKKKYECVIQIYPFFLGGFHVIDGNQSFSIPDTLCVSWALPFFFLFSFYDYYFFFLFYYCRCQLDIDGAMCVHTHTLDLAWHANLCDEHTHKRWGRWVSSSGVDNSHTHIFLCVDENFDFGSF